MSDSKNIFFSNQDYQGLKHLNLALIFFCFFTMTFGSTVRNGDAGLSCPDWPWCYDAAVPYLNTAIFLEWFHRVLAALLGVGLLVFFSIILFKKNLRRHFQINILALTALFFVQVILGGLTVLKMLDPTIVSLHLINASLLFMVLISTFHRFRSLRLTDNQPLANKSEALYRKSPLWLLFAVLTLVQIGWGGAVSTSHSGLACPDFPMCHGSWLPSLDSLFIVLHLVHRYLGFVLGGLALGILIHAVLIGNKNEALYVRSLGLFALVMSQIILGAVNVLWEIPAWASVLHLGNAFIIAGYALWNGLAMPALSVPEQTTEQESHLGSPQWQK